MAVKTPSLQEIRDQIITDIENALNQTVPLIPKAFNRVLANAVAGAIFLVYKFGLWIYQQIFVQTSDDDSLVNQGELVGVIREAATPTVLQLDCTGTDTVVINAGFKWLGTVNKIQYITKAAETITGGVASIQVEALEAGDAGDLGPGSELQAVQPAPGIDNLAIVDSIIENGSDQESLDDYRARVLERYQRKPQGGALIDYIVWAKEVDGITRAFAFNTSPGYVTVYPLNDDDPGGRLPDGATITEVFDYINSPSRIPITANLIVTAMTETSFVVEISNLITDTPALRVSIEANILAYLEEREPLQFADQTDKNNVVSASVMIAIAIDSGAQSLDLVLKKDATPISTYTLQYFELAVGTVSFSP